MIHKSIEVAEAKALEGEQGMVEAFTNTMGVIDKDGDVIDPIAFNGSIAKNLPIPVLAGHDQHTVVGKVLTARPVHITDDEYKLYTLMQMNMETQGGREAFSNVKGNFVREWSVGFNVPEDGITYDGKGKAKTRRIKELDWVEVSTVIRGASPQTATISAKSEDANNGDELEAIASDTEVQETDASDTELLQAQIELLRLKSKKKKKPRY
tara:strand:+ start:38 stop:667 length:630 start_codon:yes stop_codon:yes gene_type:complete